MSSSESIKHRRSAWLHPVPVQYLTMIGYETRLDRALSALSNLHLNEEEFFFQKMYFRADNPC